ncbi:hypothetical protein F4804DRAFT_244700 [Jackrogersella minutella]|nr:hypothetical protein F4804DRAFT_244700 [Jackrogersella minutella]
MGKSRRNRAKGGHHPDPIGKPVKPPSDPELAALREKSILPVLRDLQSPEPKSRTAAAGAVANIVQDARCRKLLLREKIVHILLNETLADTSLESRAAGWEILRVLTAEEEPDFCIHLYRLDILTAMSHACFNIRKTLTTQHPVFSKTTKAEQNVVWSITESILSILSALAEAHDEALEAAVRNEAIVRLFFILLNINTTTGPVLNSALSCMITLTEDNQHFAEAIIADNATGCYNRLTTFKNSDGYKAVLASAVLHNIFSALQWNDQNPGKNGACDAVLIPVLSRALHSTQLKGSTPRGEGSMIPAEVVQLALEVLASIGTDLQGTFDKGSSKKVKKPVESIDKDVAMETDSGDEQLSDNELAEEDDDMDEDEMEADMEMVTGVDGDDKPEGIDDLPTLKALLHTAIPRIMGLIQACSSDDEASKLILNHAITALNNISWTVSCFDFDDKSNTAILRAWTPVAHRLWEQVVATVLSNDTSDIQLAAIVTSLAWAVARTLHGQTFLNGDEPKKFVSLYHASRNLNEDLDDPFQGLGVKCIGVLGQLALAAPSPLNREIGIFLVTVVKGLPETPAADVVEALNQVFDIYGDENKEWDKDVFWKNNFLHHLQEVVSLVKVMVKTIDKRTSNELRVRAEDANLNLSRFIQYKQKHRP